jgi:protein involved in polysaccharide export with SLBB domain
MPVLYTADRNPEQTMTSNTGRSAMMRHEGSNQVKVSSRITFLIGIVAMALCLVGCSAISTQNGQERDDFAASSISPEQCAANASIQESAEQDPGYRIQPGDQLGLDFYRNSEFNDDVTVDPEGKITLRMVGSISAKGETPSQLAASIDKAYKNELRNPGAVVHLRNSPNRQIYVEGEVAKPGAFPLQPGMTTVQALALAGGVTVDSAPDGVILIRRDACGQEEGSRIDLAEALKQPGSSDDVALMPHDVVVVPRSKIANLDLFVKHYIKDLLPVDPYIGLPF